MFKKSILVPILIAFSSPVVAQEAQPEAWPEANFEIFKLAPGEQEAFIRSVAKSDEVSRAIGIPPIQLYIHKQGADWDVLLLKRVRTTKLTPEQEATLAQKRIEIGVPSGPEAFLDIRKKVAAHSDTIAVGPITAEAWLARLDADRAARKTKK
ncbi:MAG: hypothetical protein J0H88_03100 [Sphingomonadales bacterium]|nr:hypothetical protein [Sphingomonadales bacterium]